MEFNARPAHPIKTAAAAHLVALLFWATLSLECSATRFAKRRGLSLTGRPSSSDRPLHGARSMDTEDAAAMSRSLAPYRRRPCGARSL
jgi:hypothetical protein